MQVDGLGERPLIDSGGFPVVWIGAAGCTIGQDPSQGGTNCYGPGDVLTDADTGAQYQIGSDWHVRQLGAGDSTSSPPADAAPTLSDRLYYVDSGEIIEKDTYSDGSVTYSDTGMSSPLSDGTASGNPADLQRTSSSTGSPDGSGFQATNPGGGYGPYATPDPPQLTDMGTYVQNGELFDHQVDQYGNDYYSDLGPAPPGSAPSPPIAQHPAPSVPTPRGGASVGAGTAPIATTPAPGTAGAPEPTAADGQRLSGQNAVTQAAYRGLYGANAANVWVAQHNAAIGQSASTPPSGGAPRPSGAPTAIAPRVGSRSTTGGPVTVPGDPQQWAKQLITWLSAPSSIGHMPNGVLVLGSVVGYSMLKRRGMFR